ncbi:hypothetical protein HEB94_000860 [Actinopolymorpha pittospori]|uniref:Uncharacterized protein n=1 Tax=Actinopolymorpha pittospori TaxID=648752 RepID=A0A927MPW1_9ACTN|nr:hypothetical protein [Actinopolymorpha pittospori]
MSRTRSIRTACRHRRPFGHNLGADLHHDQRADLMVAGRFDR